MPAWITSRLLFLGMFIACAGMMGVGYWMQYGLELEPCPLCMTQRVFIVLTGLTGLLAALHGPGRTGTRVYGALAMLFALTGGGFSSRHLYLQSLPPDKAPACGPSIDYILDTFPLMDALEVLLRGNGNCAEVDWSFLGISIPGWTLVGFLMLAAVAACAVLKPIVRKGISK